MIRDWYGECCARKLFLHDNVAAPLALFHKSMRGKDVAYLLSRKNAKFTQRQPPLVLHTLPHVILSEFPPVKLFQKKLQSFPKFYTGFLDGIALTGNIELRTKRNITVTLALNNCGELFLHGIRI